VTSVQHLITSHAYLRVLELHPLVHRGLALAASQATSLATVTLSGSNIATTGPIYLIKLTPLLSLGGWYVSSTIAAAAAAIQTENKTSENTGLHVVHRIFR